MDKLVAEVDSSGRVVLRMAADQADALESLLDHVTHVLNLQAMHFTDEQVQAIKDIKNALWDIDYIDLD